MVIGTVFEASARCVTVGRVSFDLFSKAERVWEHVNHIILTSSKLHTALHTLLEILLEIYRGPARHGHGDKWQDTHTHWKLSVDSHEDRQLLYNKTPLR